MRTCVRVPRRYSPYSEFQHWLKRGNLHMAWTSAHQVEGGQHLKDALDLLALAHAKRSPRYSRAAVVWVARLLAREDDIDVEELRLVIAELCDDSDGLAERVWAVLHRPERASTTAVRGRQPLLPPDDGAAQ